MNTMHNRVTPRQRGRRNTPRKNTPGSDRKTRQQTKRITPQPQKIRSFENSDDQVVNAAHVLDMLSICEFSAIKEIPTLRESLK